MLWEISNLAIILAFRAAILGIKIFFITLTLVFWMMGIALQVIARSGPK
jgi:hypothetical protein